MMPFFPAFFFDYLIIHGPHRRFETTLTQQAESVFCLISITTK